MLAGFMMADHTAGARPQNPVMAREVTRRSTDGRTLEATSRVCGRRHYARRQRKSQNCGHQNPFHRIFLIAGVNVP